MRELNTRAERTVEAPAGRVWAYRLDFLRLPEYNPSVTAIERVDAGGSDGVGASYRFDLVTGSRSTRVDLRVTEAVPGELVAIDMDGGLPARERFSLSAAPAPDGGDPDGKERCLVAIALTLLVPDHVPSAHDEAMLANGQSQIAGELDRMREILGATPDRSFGGDSHG